MFKFNFTLQMVNQKYTPTRNTLGRRQVLDFLFLATIMVIRWLNDVDVHLIMMNVKHDYKLFT